MKKNLLIIDSPALCHRAKHAMKNAALSHEEMHTEIIFNFLNQILSLAKRFETDAFAFAWDSKKSFRRTLYPEYKYKRREEKTEEEKELEKITRPQFQILRRDVIPALGFKNNFVQTGLEADDIMSDIAMRHGGNGVIVTRDNDLFQNIRKNIRVFDFQTKKILDVDKFRKRFNGLYPFDWGTVKSIAGCTTDNVAGIVGVKEKTAIKYIQGELPKHHKTFKAITSEEGREIIKRNLKLVVLPFDGTKDFVYQEDVLHSKDFYDTFEQLNFKSFISSDSFREWEEAFNLQ